MKQSAFQDVVDKPIHDVSFHPELVNIAQFKSSPSPGSQWMLALKKENNNSYFDRPLIRL